MKTITLIAALLLAAPAHGGQFTALISAAFNVSPGPAPSGECDNCNGTGKLGDGTVSVTCPVCNGTGKKPAATAPRQPWPPTTIDPPLIKAAAALAESSLPADAQPTPIEGVRAGLEALNPQPGKTLVVFGSGFDARWEREAARMYPTLKIKGIEIDPDRAESARLYVQRDGLGNRVQIYTGDATNTTFAGADYGAAYLFPDTLAALRPQIEKLERFVSYAHPVPGLGGTPRAGNIYVYAQQKPAVQYVRRSAAVWNGRTYTRAKAGCNCAMCRSIRAQLATPVVQQVAPQQAARGGHYENVMRKVCNRGVCTWVVAGRRWVPD